MASRRSTRLSSSSALSDVEGQTMKDNEAMPPPATPSPRKRRKINGADPPPFTPTPSAIGLMAAPSLPRPDGGTQQSPPSGPSPTKTPKTPRARKARPAQPHATNVPLQTPRGSKIIANLSNATIVDSADSGDEEPTTTANLLTKAEAFLIRQDPRLKSLIDANHCQMFSPEGLAEDIDPFKSLSSGIMAQQVSGAAAKSIQNKFVALFNEDEADAAKHVYPSPEQVAKTDLVRLRSAGLSQRKAEYIQGLAEKFAAGELTTRMLAEASDEEVLEKLVAVRGLGRWSVEMFCTFSLRRTDIFSTGDLGVQRGIAQYLGRDVAKLKNKGGKFKYASEAEMLDVAAKFSPYRSIFMWLMWRMDGVNLDVLQPHTAQTTTTETS